MSGSNDQQQQPQQAPPLDQNALLQLLIRQQLAAASGQGQQVQLPSLPTPPAQTQYSNDPSKGPDLLERIGLALGGGSLPGAPAELRAQMGRQGLLNFGIGLMSAGKFATPGEVLAGGLRGAQQGLLGSEAAQAGQQEYALNAQGKLLGLGIEQQKARTEALNAALNAMLMQGRLGLPPLFGGGGGAGGPGGGDGDPAASMPKDEALAYIAKRESGNQNIPNMQGIGGMPLSTASGYYQMLDSTWREAAKGAGIDTTQYPRAMSAPKELQDKAASWLYDKYGVKPWAMSAPTAQPPAAATAGPVGPYKVAGRVVAPPAAGGPPAPSQPPSGDTWDTSGGPTPPAAGPPSAPAPPAPVGPVKPPAAPAPSLDPETGLPVQTAAVTPPASVVPPAAQPAPPAAQPPGQPPAAQPAQPPASAEYPGDVQATPEQYMREHYQAATPEEVARYAPGPTGEAARNAAQKVQDAQQQLTAARTQLQQIRQGQMPGDPNKAMSDVQAAQNELDKNRSAYDEEVQKLAQSGAGNLLTRDNAEKTRVSQNYQKVQDREQQNQQQAQTLANNIRLKEIEGEQQRITNREAVGNKVNQDTLTQAVKDQIDARNLAASVEGFQTMTANIGQPGWLQTTKNPFGQGETIAEKLGQMGVPVNDTGGIQAMQAGINEMIKSLRAGMPMGSLSDRDLDFIRRMGPTEWMDPDTRMAVTSYIMQAARAKQQFSYEIQKNLSKPGANAADAIEAADRKVKSFVPEVPFSSSQWSDRSPDGTAKRMQWLQDHPLPPGTLYHLNDGSVMISKRPGSQQPARPQSGPAVGYGNQ